MSCVDVRLSLTSVDYCNLLISGGERGDQLWLPKDGWDLPSQDRTKRQVRIVTFILNCTEILLYPRFGHLGVAINLITYDDRFALHRWVFSAPNVRTLQLTSFQCYNFSVLTFFLYSGLNRSLGLRSDRYPGWVVQIATHFLLHLSDDIKRLLKWVRLWIPFDNINQKHFTDISFQKRM